MKPLFVYAAPIEGDAIAPRLPEALRLGVGKTEAAMSLSRRLASRSRPDVVIAFGVCGAYRPDTVQADTPTLRPLDLCLVETDSLADEGVETPGDFLSLADLGLGSTGPFVADAAWNERAASALERPPIVRGATVSACSGSDSRATAIARRSSAAIETMEGAAIARVCTVFEVPWIQVRCVSNYCGDRERGEWRLEFAATRLADSVLRLARAI